MIFKNILYLLLFCILKISSFFNIYYDQIVFDDIERQITLDCHYETDNYILQNSLRVKNFKTEDISFLFEMDLQDLYTPLFSHKLQVLPLKGNFKILFYSVDDPFSKIELLYDYYDSKKNKIIKDEVTSFYVSNYKQEENVKEEDLKIESFFEEQDDSQEEDQQKELENSTDLKEVKVANVLEDQIKDTEIEQSTEKKGIFERLNNRVYDLLRYFENPFIILFIIFLLGILMSLTPCIYPMIPITISILQKNKDKNLNMHALCYVLGVASTFAVLGVLAVSGMMVFGTLLSKSFFLVIITIFLFFLSGSMLGFYSVPQIPFISFFSESNSLFSSFLFGMFSGTISSPCVSPGLFTLLTLVSDKGDYISGFIMLFFFGLGLGFPLFIGSISLKALPKAGYWMEEVKKILGVVILFIGYNYLELIIGTIYASLLYFVFLTLLGIYFIIIFQKNKQKTSKGLYLFRYFIFIPILFSSSMIFLKKTYKHYTNTNKEHEKLMNTNFDEAREIALLEDKYLLLDFTAEWCDSCKKVSKLFFYKKDFWNLVTDYIIPVKIDCTNLHDEKIRYLLEHYKVAGFPSILLINPVSDELIEQFDSSIIFLTKEKFAKQINEKIESCVKKATENKEKANSEIKD